MSGREHANHDGINPTTTVMPVRNSTPPPARQKSTSSGLIDSCDMSTLTMTSSPVATGTISSAAQLPPRPHGNVLHHQNHYHPATTMMELTPVTRNTDPMMYVDGGGEGDSGGNIVISPDEQDVATADDDHLALPTGTDFKSTMGGPKALEPKRSSNSSVVKLISPRARAQHRALADQRSKSVGMMLLPEGANWIDSFEREERGEVSSLEPLPMDRKSLTFTSRDEKTVSAPPLLISPTEVTSPPNEVGRIPYQPSRSAGVGLMNSGGELSRIFIPRTSGKAEEEYKPHPMERQWSIPSIRLANQVMGGSTTTCSYTDEEDDLKELEDDASWSTRGSSLCLPSDEQQLHQSSSGSISGSFQQEGTLVGMMLSNESNANTNSPSLRFGRPTKSAKTLASSNSKTNSATLVMIDDLEQVKSKAERQRTRDREALDWLRTVQPSSDDEVPPIAEAASSKFLTSGPPTNKCTAKKGKPVLLKRQQSTPAALSSVV